MQGYFAIITIISLMTMVPSRAFILKRQGIKVMQFGEMDKKNFLIPPFALLFLALYLATLLTCQLSIRYYLKAGS